MNKTLPTHPIEKVYIGFSGDSSVGIPDTSFEMSVYFHPDSLEDLASFRKAISDLYEVMQGEEGTVLFDYELEEMNRVEASFDEHMDGDFDSGMASAGFGTDEDYGGGDERL